MLWFNKLLKIKRLHYTINALHAPRQNERATALYQLLKVNEAPLDSRTKHLDMFVFQTCIHMV